MFSSIYLVQCFGGLFVYVFSRLAGDRQMSPLFQMVHRPPLLPTTDRFPQHQYCLRCLSAWRLFVLDDLWNEVVCFQPPSLLIGKVWVPVMHFCVCRIHCKVHWRVHRRLGSYRLISGHPLTGSTIREFCISSSVGIGGTVLSIFTQFLSNRSQHVMVNNCCSKLVKVVSGLPQGSIFRLLLFLLYTSELFSILENKLIRYADDSTLIAVVPSPGVRVRVAVSKQ